MIHTEEQGAHSYRPICDACGKDYQGRLAPMLRDEVWQQLANKTQILCDPCCQERAKTLEIEITLATLEPCPFNLIGWSNSHFNRFAASTNDNYERS